MKVRRRSLILCTVSLVCFNAASCLRDLDVSKIKCADDSSCPSGYSCSKSQGTYGSCVAGPAGGGGSSTDLSGSDSKGGLDGILSGGGAGGESVDGPRGEGGATTTSDGGGGASGPIDANLAGASGGGTSGGSDGSVTPDGPSVTGDTTSTPDVPITAGGPDATTTTADGSDCSTCTDEPMATTCAGGHCGPTTNNCGHTVQCSTTCSIADQTCGGGGVSGICGCTAVSTSETCGNHCGTLTNNCGLSVDCGGCTSPNTCGGGSTANVCGCTPNCTGKCGGSDSCGGTCPNNCVSPQTCGGGGTANVCGCTPNCAGKCGGDNGCGGTCPNNCVSPQVCGGGGTANVCACPSSPSWGFESGTTEGWSIMTDPQTPENGSNKVTNLLVSSSRANNGSHSLAVQMSFDGVSDVYASVAVPLCQQGGVNLAGYTLTFWVYIVPTFSSQTLVSDQSVSGFPWGPNSGDTGGIGWLGGQPNNTWLPMTFTYTDTGLMDHLGIMFLSSVQWSGTMYVDDIQLVAP